jgi:sec-independent protein translocase protein TatA
MLTFAIAMPGLPEMLVVVLLVLMLFGAGKLPSVLRQMGEGVKAFRDGTKDVDNAPGAVDVTPRPKELSKSSVTDAEEVSNKAEAG